MFTYSVQQDTIKVEPVDFGKKAEDALREEIERRYANKVIADVGLCIAVLDILQSSEGAVLYGDGCLYHKVTFRLVIFRPFVGELLVGRVLSSSEKGIIVTVGFFDDILIPPGLLPDHSLYESSKNAFFWLPDSAEEDPVTGARKPRPSEIALRNWPEDSRLYIFKKDWVRIRVHEELWDDPAPSGGQRPVALAATTNGTSAPATNGASTPGAPHAGQETGGRAPYSLICSMSEQGTGVLDWWMDDEGEDTEMTG